MNPEEKLTVKQLLAQVAEAAAATAAVLEKCAEAHWQTMVPVEERTVGVVLHHIAFAMPVVAQWAGELAGGQGAPGVSFDDVHALNAQHAADQAKVDAAATLSLLQTNAAAVQAQLGQLADADLQVSAPFPLLGGQPITAQQMVQGFLVNHAHNHLAAIHQVIGGK